MRRKGRGGRGGSALLVMWPTKLSALNPPLHRPLAGFNGVASHAAVRGGKRGTEREEKAKEGGKEGEGREVETRRPSMG